MNKTEDKNIDTLYREHAQALFSYALNLGFDRETSMDAIHDVFYKICLNSKLLDEVSHVRFYLLRSLKNHLLNINKQKKDIIELPSGNSPDDIPFTIHVTIEDSLIQTEDQEEIRLRIENLLKSLTDRQREIIYLRYTQDLDYEEISQIMNITVPACRKLVHKALTKLRENSISIFLFLFLIG